MNLSFKKLESKKRCVKLLLLLVLEIFGKVPIFSALLFHDSKKRCVETILLLLVSEMFGNMPIFSASLFHGVTPSHVTSFNCDLF